MFTNSQAEACRGTFTLVDSSNSAFSVGDANDAIFKINASGYLEIKSLTYNGSAMTAKVKGVTPFGTPLYKVITLTENTSPKLVA